jgi:hypothetical protein
MRVTVNLAYSKVEDNLMILLVLNFHGNRPFGLRITAVQSWVPEMLALWNSWTDLNVYFGRPGRCLNKSVMSIRKFYMVS